MSTSRPEKNFPFTKFNTLLVYAVRIHFYYLQMKTFKFPRGVRTPLAHPLDPLLPEPTSSNCCFERSKLHGAQSAQYSAASEFHLLQALVGVASYADILLARHALLPKGEECVTCQKNVCVGGYRWSRV